MNTNLQKLKNLIKMITNATKANPYKCFRYRNIGVIEFKSLIYYSIFI